MKKENIKKFIEYGNPMTSDAVFYMLCGQIAFSLSFIALGYNLKKSIIFTIPLIVISVIIYLIYLSLKSKKETKKNIFLFFGIMSISCSVTCQIGCFLIIELSLEEKIRLACFLIIITFLVYVITIIISILMIKYADKLTKAIKVSALAMAPFAVLGSFVSANSTEILRKNMLLLSFAIMSFVFSFLIIYIVKYYFMRLLEKQSEDGSPNDKK